MSCCCDALPAHLSPVPEGCLGERLAAPQLPQQNQGRDLSLPRLLGGKRRRKNFFSSFLVRSRAVWQGLQAVCYALRAQCYSGTWKCAAALVPIACISCIQWHGGAGWLSLSRQPEPPAHQPVWGRAAGPTSRRHCVVAVVKRGHVSSPGWSQSAHGLLPNLPGRCVPTWRW